MKRVFLPACAALLMACPSASTPPRASLGERPAPAGSTRWEAAVRDAMMSRWGRGAPLGEGDVTRVPCDIWRELEADLVRDTSDGLAITYGLEPRLLWRGDRIGLALAGRAAALERAAACIGSGPRVAVVDVTLQALLDIADPATSDPWDQAVASLITRTYDRDQSSRIDVPEEVDAIPCAIWSHLDGAVAAVSRYPMVTLYGFANGYAWAAGALGFDQVIRAEAAEALTRCGIALDI